MYSSAAATSAFAVVLVAGVAGRHGHSSLSSVLVNLVALAAAYAVALFSRRLREGADQTERLLIEAAALAERQRLAREMHDVLAHSLSGLALQLEGGAAARRYRPGRSPAGRPAGTGP